MTTRIAKIGDAGARAALFEAAHVTLMRPIDGGALKNWAWRFASRAGMNKTKVALARKLAAILHPVWIETRRSTPARRLLWPPHLRKKQGSGWGEYHDLPGAFDLRRDDGRWQRPTRSAAHDHVPLVARFGEFA